MKAVIPTSIDTDFWIGEAAESSVATALSRLASNALEREEVAWHIRLCFPTRKHRSQVYGNLDETLQFIEDEYGLSRTRFYALASAHELRRQLCEMVTIPDRLNVTTGHLEELARVVNPDPDLEMDLRTRVMERAVSLSQERQDQLTTGKAKRNGWRRQEIKDAIADIEIELGYPIIKTNANRSTERSGTTDNALRTPEEPTQRFDDLKRDYDALHEQNQQYKEDIEQTRSEINARESAIRRAEGAIAQLRQQLEAEKERNRQLATELAELRKQKQEQSLAPAPDTIASVSQGSRIQKFQSLIDAADSIVADRDRIVIFEDLHRDEFYYRFPKDDTLSDPLSFNQIQQEIARRLTECLNGFMTRIEQRRQHGSFFECAIACREAMMSVNFDSIEFEAETQPQYENWLSQQAQEQGWTIEQFYTLAQSSMFSRGRLEIDHDARQGRNFLIDCYSDNEKAWAFLGMSKGDRLGLISQIEA